jgi:Mlc titration factor MtfA (ptsG expression regulator)
VLDRIKTWVVARLARAAIRAQADPARRAALRAAPLPDAWGMLVAREVRPFARLTRAQQVRLLDDLKVFAGEKQFVGVDGFEIDDRVRVLVSASAALLVLGLDIAVLDHVTSVEVRPAVVEHHGVRHAGLYRHGEPGGVPMGVVELCWDQVVHGIAHDDGRNVVLHELAHAFDHGDGLADALMDHPRFAAWQDTLRALPLERFEGDRSDTSIVADVEGPELFAVATVLFFERPARLRRLDAELFDVLRELYQLDPHDFA